MGGEREMKITIKGKTKEIAAVLLGVQKQQCKIAHKEQMLCKYKNEKTHQALVKQLQDR